MTVRPAAGLSRIGVRTADGCFFPLMLDSFRGIRQLVLTTAGTGQDAADVELFLEEPGGGAGYQHLGTVHVATGNIEEGAAEAGRPDLVLRVALDAGRVLTATVTGPAARGELRVALQRYTSRDVTMRAPAPLAGVRETIAAGHLDSEPHRLEPAATAWLDAGAPADADAMQPVERFVHRCTSVLPLNATPDDRARIAWLVERPGLRRDEADLLRRLCSRMAGDEDPERAGFARAAMRSVDELAAEGGRDAPATEHEDAYARRDYGEVLRLLHAARVAGDPAIPADLADYWLTG
ncbi:MAG: hypothetical protein OXJ90_15545 [Spirochaetaceae bacterium]|nr:hypothetical protein [Spirochaetaceae bacterium]